MSTKSTTKSAKIHKGVETLPSANLPKINGKDRVATLEEGWSLLKASDAAMRKELASATPAKEEAEQDTVKFHYLIRVFTGDGVLQINSGGINKTKSEIARIVGDLKRDGATFMSKDGRVSTVYMPNSIQKIIVETVLLPGENK